MNDYETNPFDSYVANLKATFNETHRVSFYDGRAVFSRILAGFISSH